MTGSYTWSVEVVVFPTLEIRQEKKHLASSPPTHIYQPNKDLVPKVNLAPASPSKKKKNESGYHLTTILVLPKSQPHLDPSSAPCGTPTPSHPIVTLSSIWFQLPSLIGVIPVPTPTPPYSHSFPIKNPWWKLSSGGIPVVLYVALNISTPPFIALILFELDVDGFGGVGSMLPLYTGKATEDAAGMALKPGLGDAR
jgi:hypothetical protein